MKNRVSCVAIVLASLGAMGCESARAGHDAALTAAAKCPLVTSLLGTPLSGSFSSFKQMGTGSAKKLEGHGSIQGPKAEGAIQFR